MDSLSEVVKQKVARLKELEAEATRLRMELSEIRDAVGAAIPSGVQRVKRIKSGAPKDRKIRPGSNMFAALEVINAAGRPIHIDMLLQEMEKVLVRPVRKSTVVGQLSEYVRKGRIFSRPEASTFGLKAWDKKVVAFKRDSATAENAM